MFLRKTIFNQYGWKPQMPDHRDVQFKPTISPAIALPPMIDLRSFCPPIKDQKELASCTSHALTSCIEFLEKKDKHNVKSLSRLFLYYNERSLEGTVKIDSGANIRDGIKTLNKQGCCLEILWPYDIYKFSKKPSSNCYYNAVTHDIVKYSALNNLQDMKSCLASGYPFVFGFSVYDSFESDAVEQTGIVPIPGLDESCLGGHCVYCVGYNTSDQTFLCANSWGINWGISGYFKMPFSYLTNKNLASDFWVIQKTISE
jgi:C1A family cysteine protease